MATSVTLTELPWEDAHSETGPTYYTSNILRLFIEALERRPETQVLDVGPVCGENISFFARSVKRLYICDMFLRLDRNRREGLSPGNVWQYLDYSPQSFDGILLWELLDRLEDYEAQRLIGLCSTLVKPNGKVVVFVLGEQEVPTVVNSFVIGDGFRVYQRPQPHLDLPMRGRQNRDVLSMMTPFKPVKSFIYRNGLREFLFQHV